jgi:pimeloyl-ACP methyl ester carboxylesterase
MRVHSSPVFLTPNRLQPNYPLFVFLPGMDGTGRLLRSQTAGLERGFDVRCLAIPADDLTSWEVLTQKVVALIHAQLAEAGKRPVYLCGESFGGCLAMQVALHSPWLFDRLILVNPASSFHRRPWIAWGSQITRYLPESLYSLSSRLLLPFLANLERLAASDRVALLEAMESVPQETSIWRLSLLNQFHLPPAQLRRLTLPVLLLASGSDRLLPSLPEVHYLATVLPKTRVFVLPHSGHACLLEADVNLYEIMEKHNFLPEATAPGNEPRESKR